MSSTDWGMAEEGWEVAGWFMSLRISGSSPRHDISNEAFPSCPWVSEPEDPEYPEQADRAWWMDTVSVLQAGTSCKTPMSDLSMTSGCRLADCWGVDGTLPEGALDAVELEKNPAPNVLLWSPAILGWTGSSCKVFTLEGPAWSVEQGASPVRNSRMESNSDFLVDDAVWDMAKASLVGSGFLCVGLPKGKGCGGWTAGRGVIPPLSDTPLVQEAELRLELDPALQGVSGDVGLLAIQDATPPSPGPAPN